MVLGEITLEPWACLGALHVSALLMLIAALLNVATGHLVGVSPWLTAVAGLAFSILAPLPFFLENIFGFESIDRLFRKKASVNVIGRLPKPGTENVKRLLILSGHHDSAVENT